MKTIRTLFAGLILLGCGGGLLWSCETWELPTKKTKRNCVTPLGTLTPQIQQRKVDFMISNSSGTIDQVSWDFGNGSTTVTTGTTVSYTYPTSGTYTTKATLMNSCDKGTTYVATITVSDAVLPTVTLQAITTASTNSALAGMTITSNGNATITRYGLCYSPTNQTPEITKDFTEERTGPVAISAPLSFSLTKNIQPNTLYYVRSYAVNSVGTAYSSPVQTFRTNLNPVVVVNGTANVGVTTATVNFVMTNPGSPAAIEYGVYYSSDTNVPDVNSSAAKIPIPALGANVIVNLNDLIPNKTYYYRPFAKLPSGEIIYGNVMSFTTQVDPVAQDLIASVSFTDQSLQDVSGLNNHVKPVNNPTFTADRKGKANAAILLDGVDDYFYMAENASLRPDALSISIWIKPITLERRMQIYNKSNFTDGGNEMYSSLMKLENDIGPNITILTDIKQNSNCEGGKGWVSFPITNRIPLDTWHHLVFTYSGRSARMYFDGALQYAPDDLPANSLDKCIGGDLKFGAQSQIIPWYFYGAMDDIRIYKRALTPSEVETLKNQ